MKGYVIALGVLLGLPLAGQAFEDADDTIDPAAGAATCEAAYAELPHGTLLDLLDPEAPADRRRAALAAYQRLATLEQCPEFGYTLGQLYRHGKYLPGNLVEQDVARARELIRPMAEDGYLDAFADLAEMEMRHANARAAMKWTQVYLHFVRTVQADYVDDAEAMQFQRTAYNSHLLSRTGFVWRHLADPPLPRELIGDDLNAYLAKHEAHVTQRMRERMDGMHARVSAQDGGGIRLTRDPGACHVLAIDGVGSASASWIVEVLPSGETGRVVLENFVPNPQVAGEMRRCLSRYRFAPFDGEQSRTARISMVMGSTEGRSIRRR